VGPNLIALAIPLFFLGIVVELVIARRCSMTVYRLGDTLSDMGCGIGQQLVSTLLASTVLGRGYEWLYAHRWVTLPDGVLPWLAAFFGVEFAYYWWHRLSHEVNVLWAAHVVHHHSEDYNLAVALRQSMTTWATSLPFYLPLALLGVPTLHFAVILGVSTLYQFWIHTELVKPLGWFEKVFNGPSLHRVHHAINPRYLDKNHGAIVSFWDRLFGTYELETEPCVYGTTRPLNSFNPLWAQFEPWADLLRLARRAPSLVEAVKVFFASPAWRPAWMGEFEKRDFSRKYDVAVTPSMQRYIVAQWVLLLAGVFAFVMWGRALTMGSTVAVVALILGSIVSLPALVEGKPWARPLEAARLLTAPLVGALIVLG
jgi:sterol desaturase/sphingolipid hydroxylase (fatty acid hydroxylase superfamily)